MTEQQKLFVDIFIGQRRKNATKAAIEAGYSKKTAASQASQLLKNPKLSEYIDIREEELFNSIKKEFKYDAIDARKVLEQIMSDPGAKDSDKISAAKFFIEVSGFAEKKKVEVSVNEETNSILNGILEQLNE